MTESDLLRERVIRSISTVELERRWKALHALMKLKKVDFLVIQNNNDYLGGYVKWVSDVPAAFAYPVSVIFPFEEEMTMISHGTSDPKKVGPPSWLLRGVRKRINTPIMLSLNYTTSYDAEIVVNELKEYKECRIALVNEGAMTSGFTSYIRCHLSPAKFIDITDEIDEIKAIKSPEEIDCIRQSAYIHDEAMKTCLEAIRPGIREYEIALKGANRFKMLGGQQGFVLVGSAPPGNTFPNSPINAMNRVIQEGDQVGILVEATDPAGYYTHLHRTACLGKIPEELQKLFEDAKEAQKLTLGLLKPGVDLMDILAENNEFMLSRGYPEEKRLFGHGQGYDLVERPSFQSGETMKIICHMNIAVHPVVSGKGTGTLCDNYIVTEEGVSECLHKTPQQIFVVCDCR